MIELTIEQHEGGYLLRWYVESEEGAEEQTRIIVSDDDMMAFVADRFGHAARAAVQATKPNRAGMN